MKEIEKLTPKQEFLAAFEETFEDEILPKDWSDAKKKIVADATTNAKIKSQMYMQIPMTCRGSKCQFAETCSLFKQGVAPIDYPCPWEVGIVKNFTMDYAEQLEVDFNNTVEMSIIRDLVDQEVQYMRKEKYLAKEDFIQDNVIGIDRQTGEPIFQKGLHIAVEYEDRIFKRKQHILKTFMATREAQAKNGMAALENAATMANLLEKARNISRARDEEVKQQLGYVEQDDYIQIPPENVSDV